MLKTPRWMALLFQKRMLLILALGLASGLPLGLTGTALQAWYATEEVSIVTIGLLGLVGQPYVYKFLWAPMIDRYPMPFLGLRRGWMITMQLGLMALIIAMGCCEPRTQPYLIAFLALCLAFFSATQDIAIDAYRTELLLPEERGLGASMAVSGYRAAMWISSGLALILAHHLGFKITYFIMAALMSVGILATLWGPEPKHYRSPSEGVLRACILPLKEFLARENALWILAFIIFYKLGDAFASSLTSLFLLNGIGFSLLDVGAINKTVALPATLLGVFLGGLFMVKLGLFRSLLYFGIIQAMTNLLFYVLAKVGANYTLMITTIFLENFGGGLGTAAYMALVMSLCHPQYTATQFALISSLAAVGRVYLTSSSGYLVEQFGWANFYVLTVLFAVPGLILLWGLRSTIERYGSRSEDDFMQSGIEEAKANA